MRPPYLSEHEERLAERTPACIDVLLPDRAWLAKTGGSHGGQWPLKRTVNHFAARGIDEVKSS